MSYKQISNFSKKGICFICLYELNPYERGLIQGEINTGLVYISNSNQFYLIRFRMMIRFL
jgi:hypothetical protein